MSENLEDYPSTNDGGYDFVQQIFKNMGGQVRPPNRPNKGYRLTLSYERDRDNFMMDFENACLQQNWGSKPFPTGPNRYENEEWAKMIQGQVYPHNSDVDWQEYVDWVKGGGGDEWFVETEDDKFP